MRLAVTGTFDVENYGDLLLASVAARRLQALRADVVFASPAGGPPVWSDTVSTTQTDALLLEGQPVDGFIIGGGNIIHAGRTLLPRYQNGGYSPLVAYANLWLVPDCIAEQGHRPVAWNAPGVAAPFAADVADVVREAADRAAYLSVRDELSRQRLRDTGVTSDVAVVPDPGLDVRWLWPMSDLQEARARLLQSDDPGRRDQPMLAVHLNARYADASDDQLAQQLDAISISTGHRIALVATAPCHGDDLLAQSVASQMSSRPFVLARPTSLLDVASIIGLSRGYIGSSLHGLVTAAAFGQPALLVAAPGSTAHQKGCGFLSQFGLESWTVPNWSEAARAVTRLLASEPSEWSRVPQLAGPRLDRHWEGVRRAVSSQSSPSSGAADTTRSALERHRTSTLQILAGGVAAQLDKLDESTRTIAKRDRATEISRLRIAELEADHAQLQALRDEQLQLGVRLGDYERRLHALLHFSPDASCERCAAMASAEPGIGLATSEDRVAETLRSLEERAKRRQVPIAALRRVSSSLAASGSAEFSTAGRRMRSSAASHLRSGTRSDSPAVRRLSRGALSMVRRARSSPARAAIVLPVAAKNVDPADDLFARLQRRNSIVIIIPVYNAAQALSRCLASLFVHTTLPHQVLLMDDGSTDPQVQGLLAEALLHDHVRVVRSETNRGFTRTVNAAFALTGEDVVLLNSDTEVGPRWLEGLVVAAHQADNVATATPFSDNAGAFSAPLAGSENDLPSPLTTEAAARAVRQFSARHYPRVPTGHGFCMYIRRSALEFIGPFDEQSFPRGYGEENDFCMRASAEGLEHVLDDTTYVRHERSASFGDEKAALLKAGRSRLDVLHPGYSGAVQTFLRDPLVLQARADVGNALATAGAAPSLPKPRLLYVLHDGTGGTPATNADLMRGVAADYECYTLIARGDELLLHRHGGSEPVLVRQLRLDRRWHLTDDARADYRAAALSILLDGAFELVHVRHLLGHSLQLPEIAKELGIPVVMSFHDFYISCPTVHLIDDNDRFCGGRCTPGKGLCRISTNKMRDVPPLKHEFVHEWRRDVGRSLSHVDTFITTSSSAQDVMERSLPWLKQRRFLVIPHGRDLGPAGSTATAPIPGASIKLLVPGNIGKHKGATFLRELWETDGGRRLDLHFLGRTDPELYDVGTHHGEYAREDFAARVAALEPNFIGVFAIWAETYSHTLTEAWSIGVPVIASDIGVLRDRVLDTGAGWLVPAYDARAAYAQILAAADDPAAYEERRAKAEATTSRSVVEMAADYRGVYRSALLRARGSGSGT